MIKPPPQKLTYLLNKFYHSLIKTNCKMNNFKIQSKINSIILDAIKNHNTSSANDVVIETQDLKLLFNADNISDLIRDLKKSLDTYFYDYLNQEKSIDTDYILRIEKDDENENIETIEIVHYLNDNNNRFHTYIEISQL